jgi:hypothetical protein
MIDIELTPEEQDRLSRARVAVGPPPGLEERTVSALRERGLVRPPHRRAAVAGLLAASAAILLTAAWLTTSGC